MTDWNFNIEEAPKSTVVYKEYTRKDGKKVKKPEFNFIAIWATDGLILTRTHWLPEQERWNMFKKDSPPKAWQPYLIPELPTIEHEEKSSAEVSK